MPAKKKQAANKVMEPESDSGSEEEVVQRRSAFVIAEYDDDSDSGDDSSSGDDSDAAQIAQARSRFHFDEDSDEDGSGSDDGEDDAAKKPAPAEPSSEDEPEEVLPPAHLKGAALKKWKQRQAKLKQKQEDDDDLDDLIPAPTPTPAPAAAEATPPPGLSKTALKKWKQNQAKLKAAAAAPAQDDDFLDDLVDTKAPPAANKPAWDSDVIMDKPPPGLSKNNLQKWKKKQAQLKAAAAAAAPAVEATPAAAPTETAAPVEAKEADAPPAANTPAWNTDVISDKPPPGLSKTALKKWKDKQKKLKAARDAAAPEPAVTEDDAKGDDAKGDDASADAGPAKPLTKAQKKKAAQKRAKEAEANKRSALSEKIRAAKAAEAKAREEEEERIRAEEEAERLEEERVAKEAAEKEVKRQARLEKRAQDRKDGILLSKKEKARIRAAEENRKRMEAAGLVPVKGTATEGTSASRTTGRRKAQGGASDPMSKKKRRDEQIRAALKAEEDEKMAAAAAAARDAFQHYDDDIAALAKQLADLDLVAAEQDGAEEEELDDWDVDSEEERNKEAAKAEEIARRAEQKAKLEAVRDAKIAEVAEKRRVEAERVAEAQAKAAAKAARAEARRKEKEAKKNLRSPIVCIMGHVDHGKTKILDYIRNTDVQDKEAGGITQQIGATYFPIEAVKQQTKVLNDKLPPKRQVQYNIPGFLIIDTPGHASFTNLRTRGSGLCDIAILVIDVNKGIQAQTIESIGLLRAAGTPFIVALNQIDRTYGWVSTKDNPIQDSMAALDHDASIRVRDKITEMKVQLAEQKLNAALYWENPDVNEYVNCIPTSAITGEGIGDLLLLMTQMCQFTMTERLTLKEEIECAVLDVKKIEGLGYTIDVLLVNGTLHEGDTIVLCGLKGPIVTTIKSRGLLTPQPLKESRVKGQYTPHHRVKAAMGIKVVADNLEYCLAGGKLLVHRRGQDIEELKEEVMGDLQSIMTRVDSSGKGVFVVASTLGSLEALLSFLEESKIPVSGISIGDVTKADVIRASVMLDSRPEYATVLAFNVKVSAEAADQAERLGVKVFTAEIIYHLFDSMVKYLAEVVEERKEKVKHEAVFPVILDLLKDKMYHNKDPIIMGVCVAEGTLRIGTPLCVPSRDNVMLGYVDSIKTTSDEDVKKASVGQEVCIKIVAIPGMPSCMYGRQFEQTDRVLSKISRRSIDILKQYYTEEMTKEWWLLIMQLKKVYKIM